LRIAEIAEKRRETVPFSIRSLQSQIINPMSLSSRILDRLALKPSREPIDPEQRRQKRIDTPAGKVEVWVYDHRVPESREQLVAIKFPGAAGRAERAGPHPFECWPHVSAEIWAVNMPGYGGSDGRASLDSISDAARSVWEEADRAADRTPPIVIGNSLGCAAALFLAARFQTGGLMLRNPVPIRELVLGRHSWWNAGLLTRWLVRAVPDELDTIDNARRATAPAYFFQSAHDRLVAPRYQNLIIDAYAGPKQVFRAPGMDHHDPVPEQIQSQYRESLQWLNEYRSR
jgi:hypothetical protein